MATKQIKYSYKNKTLPEVFEEQAPELFNSPSFSVQITSNSSNIRKNQSMDRIIPQIIFYYLVDSGYKTTAVNYLKEFNISSANETFLINDSSKEEILKFVDFKKKIFGLIDNRQALAAIDLFETEYNDFFNLCPFCRFLLQVFHFFELLEVGDKESALEYAQDDMKESFEKCKVLPNNSKEFAKIQKFLENYNIFKAQYSEKQNDNSQKQFLDPNSHENNRVSNLEQFLQEIFCLLVIPQETSQNPFEFFFGPEFRNKIMKKSILDLSNFLESLQNSDFKDFPKFEAILKQLECVEDLFSKNFGTKYEKNASKMEIDAENEENVAPTNPTTTSEAIIRDIDTDSQSSSSSIEQNDE